jgi:hypothetical protein
VLLHVAIAALQLERHECVIDDSCWVQGLHTDRKRQTFLVQVGQYEEFPGIYADFDVRKFLMQPVCGAVGLRPWRPRQPGIRLSIDLTITLRAVPSCQQQTRRGATKASAVARELWREYWRHSGKP